MPDVKSVFFGLHPIASYDTGVQPCIAINSSNRCVEAHRGKDENKLFFRVADVNGVSLTYQAKQAEYTNGQNPSVAFANDSVLEAHDDGSGKIYFSLRALQGDSVSPAVDAREFPNPVANSSKPSVAANTKGALVAIHSAGSNLVWRAGTLDNSLKWSASQPLASNRSNASVSINKDGRVVVVYQKGDDLYYRIGAYVPPEGDGDASIDFEAEPSQRYDTGNDPSVTITDDEWVYEVHKSEAADTLYQRVGRISGTSIAWQPFLGGNNPSYLFDAGKKPRVATNGKVAVVVNEFANRIFLGSELDEGLPDKALLGTASLVFDRANWINDHRGKLGDKTLRNLVLPASHDAAQYLEGRALQSQTLDIFGQLSAGVRWFDLRLVLSLGTIKIHHAGFAGVDFQDVLNDIRTFMKDHTELVILKISHFLNFDAGVFATAISMIRDAEFGLSPWLVTRDLKERLAEKPLNRLIGRAVGKGAVLVVVDNTDDDGNVHDYLEFDPRLPGNRGIRRYRDWYAPDPQNGDLTVFDIYGNTRDFDTMATGTENDPDSVHAVDRNGRRLEVGQFPKFDGFDGVCRFQDEKHEDVPCDLFLLSWTLTIFAVAPVGYYHQADQQLVRFSASRPNANAHGRIINLLYTDVSQNSRSTDVALIRNGLVS